jgi:hypothetical protein
LELVNYVFSWLGYQIKGRMTPCSTDELSFTGSEENFPPSFLLESLPRFTHMEVKTLAPHLNTGA